MALLLTLGTGRPDIIYALDTPASIKALKDKPFTLKEGEAIGWRRRESSC